MSSLPGSQILKCHPELAVKFVETKSKRDFMPLPAVSGSLYFYVQFVVKNKTSVAHICPTTLNNSRRKLLDYTKSGLYQDIK